MLKTFARVGVLATILGCLTSAAFAQGGSAVISGTVFDQAQAVLPGAVVTATNEATGIVRETVTGGEGRFVFPTLQPGTYTVTSALPGFQTRTSAGLVLNIGGEMTLNMTMSLAGVEETVTVTGEAPIVEVTASRIGSIVSNQEIDQLPAQGRNHLALMQLVPGLVPDLEPGEFEGGNFNANGQATSQNLWTMDGAANQDTDGGGSGPQARVSLDSMAEFQVLTHQYTAEYGGSSGVIVNAVTKSGTNTFSGRLFDYYEDDKLRARDPFLDADEPKPDSGRKTFGFNVGGPIAENRAFFFFNLERTLVESAVVHTMPAEAAPLAVSYADATIIKALNTFARVDYTAGASNFSFRWAREVAPAVGEDYECCQTLDNRAVELDSNDRMFNIQHTALIGNNATNELRFSHVGEDRVEGNLAYMGLDSSVWKTSGWIENLEYVGLNGRDQFDIGSTNAYEDFTTGLADAHGGSDSRNYTLQEAFTIVPGTGAHTFKAGFTYNKVKVAPQRIGGGDNGVFEFFHNTPFDPGNPFTYPSYFEITLGDILVNSDDDWYNWYVQDQWRASDNLTLNAGLRWDYQDLTPDTKDAFSPRIGFAYDVGGTGDTVIRGGIGKFYEYHLIGVRGDLNRRGVFSQTFSFETDEDESFADGIIPSDPCLQPVLNDGIANISPACRTVLTGVRSALQPGAGAEFVNDEPIIDGDRKMGYQWGYSLGVQRELMANLAVAVDYVGNRGRDQSGLVDINEGPPGANGRITRPGVDGFDPNGSLIAASARDTHFRRVLQFQTLEAMNTDFDSLEVSLEKRYSNRWSSRLAYTLGYANDVGAGSRRGRYTNDLDIREDYGRANFDNRHGFVASLNVNPIGGLNTGIIFRTYSGYPINERIGRDANGDRDNVDRPVAGVDDGSLAIVSPLNANGRAVRNGIDGESSTLVDLQVQYIVNLPRAQTMGFFWEAYNALNKINLGNGTGNRRSSRFLEPDEAAPMRSMQLGVRYTF